MTFNAAWVKGIVSDTMAIGGGLEETLRFLCELRRTTRMHMLPDGQLALENEIDALALQIHTQPQH